jgi:hypothetical protein
MTDTNIINIDALGDYIKYTCKISKSSIIFNIKENILLIENSDFNWTYPKLVMNLIKYAFVDISDKYDYIKYFKYTIPVSELEFIDESRFAQKYININNTEYVELQCDINIAFENFIVGFMN